MLYPDSVVGTDSHTTMIDGLGVAGWGVGGIEAEAAMLGQVYIISRKIIYLSLDHRGDWLLKRISNGPRTCRYFAILFL